MILIVRARAPADCAVVTMFRNMISFDFRFRKTIPFDSKNIGDVLIESLSAPELLTKLSAAAVLQGGRFDWESTSKKTWSELLALAKRSKEGAC